MEFEVNMVLQVEEDACFLEADRQQNEENVLEQIRLFLYDMEEVEIKHIEVETL